MAGMKSGIDGANRTEWDSRIGERNEVRTAANTKRGIDGTNRPEWDSRIGERERQSLQDDVIGLPPVESPDRPVDGALGYRLVKLNRVAGTTDPDDCRALLTVIGQDRTGVIATVSRQLWDLGLNILGSFGTLLDDGPGLVGEGLVLLLSGTEARMQALERKVAEVDGQPLWQPAGRGGKSYELRVLVPDEEGIVCRIAEALAKYRVNLSTMMTRNTVSRDDGPGGVAVILAVIIMTLQVPESTAIDLEARLTDELRRLLPKQRKISLRDDTEWQ
jgi:predicted amino acid-binding ACT domain protein